MEIRIQEIQKSFAGFPALRGVNLEVRSGELIALLGPSGSGKTTLLRVLAGLEFPDYGRILFGGEDASRLPVRDRRVGFVFQHYALFRHMTVFENIAFGLRVRRTDKPTGDAIRARVTELLELVQLAGLEQRYPAQLSGGQRQRVALARALAIDPRVLLLDEPFGALDARVRKDLRRWLRTLHDRTGYTTVFVTHDQEEALELADRVVVMNRGQIEQVGTTDEVYERPATPFVFDFLGDVNVLEGVVDGRRLQVGNGGSALELAQIHPPGPVSIYVRPHDVGLAEAHEPGIPATVASIRRTGALILLSAALDGGSQTISVELPHLEPGAKALKAGSPTRLSLQNFSLFPQRKEASAEPLAQWPGHPDSGYTIRRRG